MSALRRSPRLAAARASAPVTAPSPTNLRRSRRLAGLPPVTAAPPVYTYMRTAQMARADSAPISRNVAAAAIGREANRLYPVAWMTPDVTDKALYDRLLYLTCNVMDRIFKTGDNGRLRCLTSEEALAWVNREFDKSHILILTGMVRGWMHAPSGKWRLVNWTEEQVEIAMRQNPTFMATLEGPMKWRVP